MFLARRTTLLQHPEKLCLFWVSAAVILTFFTLFLGRRIFFPILLFFLRPLFFLYSLLLVILGSVLTFFFLVYFSVTAFVDHKNGHSRSRRTPVNTTSATSPPHTTPDEPTDTVQNGEVGSQNNTPAVRPLEDPFHVLPLLRRLDHPLELLKEYYMLCLAPLSLVLLFPWKVYWYSHVVFWTMLLLYMSLNVYMMENLGVKRVGYSPFMFNVISRTVEELSSPGPTDFIRKPLHKLLLLFVKFTILLPFDLFLTVQRLIQHTLEPIPQVDTPTAIRIPDWLQDASCRDVQEKLAEARLRLAAAGESGLPASALSDVLDGEAVASCFCPITQSFMSDPVTTADGHTYERSAIDQWLRRRRTSPLTNENLSHLDVVPDDARRLLIGQILSLLDTESPESTS